MDFQIRSWLALIVISVASVGVLAADQQADKKSDQPASAAKENSDNPETKVQLKAGGESHPPSIWMQQKLKHSQKIFAGMIEGDMPAVETAARNLQLINRLEGFVRGKSKDYRMQLRLFQYANEEILKGAGERNADRVLMGYNQMTISCVACHKQLRAP